MSARADSGLLACTGVASGDVDSDAIGLTPRLRPSCTLGRRDATVDAGAVMSGVPPTRRSGVARPASCSGGMVTPVERRELVVEFGTDSGSGTIVALAAAASISRSSSMLHGTRLCFERVSALCTSKSQPPSVPAGPTHSFKSHSSHWTDATRAQHKSHALSSSKTDELGDGTGGGAGVAATVAAGCGVGVGWVLVFG